ncbi:F0F1 ATP synthase subunit alpha [Oceanicella actignis]|uniref:ATP synthase subunit alpha n=1 Tax=Oceanicella actignis TaxID=1189325 RepID=A0A1M7S9M8_9RHOB|nr:F0F1 ATP synthase subunit alpha [Oceanicella actignis]SET30980.1 F-type H+-transporting ATPase subunit alpha [Oceanicella actignis]SHN55095.1 F-type H+-transporting ATPase subunit alpha [Oceanicella actignis]
MRPDDPAADPDAPAPTPDAALRSWLRKARAQAAELSPRARLSHVGRVLRVGDGVAQVENLPRCRLNERLIFGSGVEGVALTVSERLTGIALLGPDAGVRAGDAVRASGDIVRVPVGEALLGRVIDPLGRPLDGGPALRAAASLPVERPAPRIMDRAPVTQPLLTGLTVIDAMIPLGRGQRELIIGDRKTGKTSIAVDTIINQSGLDRSGIDRSGAGQAGSGVICVYCAIGQKASSTARVIDAVRRHGDPGNCIFVFAPPEAAPGLQWIAPYAACAMAEHFRDNGRDALVVFDDLTRHAIVYRELSLLLRRPPGREAYPGDVFHLHARLLERAARLSPALGGGSLTALPIAETQAGNLTAYIPTNLVSITDGQIYLEPTLFNEGQKPAVNVGLSVSRVGGKTQAPALRSVAERLKLEYAQYLELESFSRFGAVSDERAAARLRHGRRIRAILRQEELAPLPLPAQAALLLAADEGLFDPVPEERVPRLAAALRRELPRAAPAAWARIAREQTLEPADRATLLDAARALIAQDAAASRDAGA